MYFKLSIRNAKRSIVNYLLYITTMTILLSIMEVSNCIAIVGKQVGFQTISLPILITLLLVILVGYIDSFMLKQRAKEFANYLLLGMEKSKLSFMFLCEFLIIGIACFIAGVLIGFGIYAALCIAVLHKENEMNISLFGWSILQTFFYFCLVECLGAFRKKNIIDKLQIRELICEKDRNQKISNSNTYKKWGIVFIIDLVCLIGLLCAIVFLPKYIAFPILSIIAIPLLSSIFIFYKWLFGYLYAIRQEQPNSLYHKNRLYVIGQITSRFKTSAIINIILCICLLFSAMSFFCGVIMLQPSVNLFDTDSQQWMGVLQISLCLIFIVIYFSVLSLQQIVELKRESKGIKVLSYIGKSNKQIKELVKKQIAGKLLMPMFMTLLVLLFSIPLVNLKLNLLLPVVMHNILLRAAFCFVICFLLFYVCYFFVVYTISKQYVGIANHRKLC